MKIGSIIITVLFAFACDASTKQQKEKPAKIIKKANSIVIPAVENVARVEILRPGGELVVLEKSADLWGLTKPIQVPVSAFHASKMNAIFGKEMKRDDMVLSTDKLNIYDLSKDRAYKVSLFTKDGATPTSEFYVGKESASKSGERRSYVKTMDGTPYHVKSEISAVVRAPVKRLRSTLIFAAEPKTQPWLISIVPRKGPKVEFRRNGPESGHNGKSEMLEGTWEMTEPKVKNFKMDRLQVQQLVDAFTRISANDFGDGKTDKELDLNPPRSIVTARVGEKTIKYEIGNPAKKVYYIRILGEKQAYKVTKGPGRVLAGDYLIFKDRVEKTIPMDDIVSFKLAGEEKLQIVRKGKKWFAGKVELDSTKIAPLLGTFVKMRAVKWKHETIDEAGLNPPAAQVILRTKTATYRFEIGKIFKNDKTRYARWSDSDYVMEVPYFVWDRATFGLDKLKQNEKK